jgi:capsular polysaccharide biosynthesis protein
MVDNINASDSNSNIRIAENAIVPETPIKPDKKRNLVSGAIMGLLTGLVLTFLLEYKDRSLHTEEDVHKHMGLPVLAIIPVAERAKKKIYGGSAGPRR